MAKNYTNDRTLVETMDTEAQALAWTTPAFDALQHNNTNSQTRLYREGGGCAQMIIKGSTDSYWVKQNTNFSLNSALFSGRYRPFVMWVWFSGPASTGNMADILVGLYDGTNHNGDGARWDQKPIIEEADAYGWTPCLVYPTQPDETTGTFPGNFAYNAVRSIALEVNNGVNDVKLAGMEQSFVIEYIGGYATVATETITLTDLVNHAKDKTNDRDFGVAFQRGDSYRFRANLRYNDAAAGADVSLDETAKVVHFDNANSDHWLGFHFIADATYDTNVNLVDNFIFWNSGASPVFTGVANVGSWNVVGNTILRGGPVDLPAHVAGYQTINNKFDTCGEIDVGDHLFTGNTVSNALAGALYPDNSAGTLRAEGNAYLNCTDGIRVVNAMGGNLTLDLTDEIFSGNTDDIFYDSPSGVLTVNANGTSNPSTWRVPGGSTATVNIVNTKTLTVTGLIAGESEVRVRDGSVTLPGGNINPNPTDTFVLSFQAYASPNRVTLSVNTKGYEYVTKDVFLFETDLVENLVLDPDPSWVP